MLLEGARGRLQRDFQAWLLAKSAQANGKLEGVTQQHEVAPPHVSQPQTHLNLHDSIPCEHPKPLVKVQAEVEERERPLAHRGAGRGNSAPSKPAATTAVRVLSRAHDQRTSDDSSGGGDTRQTTDADARGGESRSALRTEEDSQRLLQDVSPEIAAAAAPHMTGNAAADTDILRFYHARASLLAQLAPSRPM
jgi:hypothetical protein